jgi:hypothetical protein
MFREYIVSFNDAELTEAGQEVNDFSDIHFRERVMGAVISLTTYRDGQAGGAEFTEHGFTFWRSTDEGGENVNVRWCYDVCDESEYTQRDVYAEQMGY